MKNIDKNAFLLSGFGDEWHGLTKREYAAIHLMLPESGDEELDKIISKAIQLRVGKAAFHIEEKK
jgi:hypothetical protein